jgi:hypothetical protein
LSNIYSRRESGHQGYRVTFTNKPGGGYTIPMHTAIRAQSKCDDCTRGFNLDTIPEASHRAFKHKPIKDFVLKMPVTKPTIPHEPNLHTRDRKGMREMYEKRAREYRKEYIRKKEEEMDKKDKDSQNRSFNIRF